MAKTLVRTTFILFILLLLRGPLFGQLREIYLDSDSSNTINRVSFFSASEGYVAFTKWIGHTTDSGRTYTQLFITNSNVNYNGYSVNLTFGFEIAGVKAFNANTVIAYGDYGLIPAILYSSNGGTSWTLVFQSQYSQGDFNGGITDMLFPLNDNTGYAIDADRILKTTDGGQTWAIAATYPGSFFNHLESVDDNTVFAMSTAYQTNKLLGTTNGGASWQAVPYPPVAGGIMTYTYFLNATTGWMSLYDGNNNLYFYKTTNSGTSWTLQNNVSATPFACSKMRFVDGNTGYALVAPFQVYKTLNSGVLWEPLPRDNNFTYLDYTLYDLQCFSPTRFWAGGGHGYLELSTNGGGTPLPTAYFAIDTTNEYASGVVNLVNYSNPAYQCTWYVNSAVISTSYNTGYTHVLSRSSDTIRLIVTSGGISDTLTKYQYFTVPNLPAISSFAPQAGAPGTFVTINGSGFSDVTAVAFGGVPATSFTILSDNVITATVAAGATGAVAVTDIHGTYSLGGFTWYPPPSGPPPSITSVSPSAGPVGTTVTISGTGFAASPSGNNVFFGTIRAIVQSASPTSLVCTVPAGASFDAIFVNNTTNGLTGQSPIPFNVSFADSSNFTPTSFSSAFTANYGESVYPLTLVGKDIDGDGKPDLLVDIRGYTDSIVVYRNTSQPGTISFTPRQDIAPIASQLSNGKFTVGDIDGDGLPDIVAITNGDFVTALRNTSTPGSISFNSGVNLPTGAGSFDAVIVDLDNDGRNDIAVAAYESGAISLLRNTGAPGILSFAATQSVTVGVPVGAIAAGDLDGDGKKDLVAYSSGNLFIFHNTGTPGNIAFAGQGNIAVAGVPLQSYFVGLVDYDGDGLPDAVIVNDNNLCIFRNISTPGNIAFASPIVTPLNIIGQGVSLSNYGGGALPDVLSGDFNLYYFLLFRNISNPGNMANNGAFQLPGSDSYYTNGADFDGDGKPDIATAYTDYHSIAILRNAVGAPQVFQLCSQNPVASVLTSDMTGATYQWQRNTGAGFMNMTDNDTLSGTMTPALSFVHTPSAWNGYKYRCLAGGLYSSIFVLQVDSLPSPGVVISTADSVTCYGSAATFTATDLQGNTNYSFSWLVDGAVTGPSTNQFSTTTLQDSNKVQVVLSYTNACGYQGDTSRAITMQVTEVPDSITIATPTLTPCSGTPVVFTATTVNAGANPTYTWTVNRIVQPETGPVFTTDSLSAGAADGINRIQATLNGSVACAFPANPASNQIDVSVIQSLSPIVQVFVDTRTICRGASLTFSATAINTGTGTTYDWLINGLDAGSVSSTFTTDSLHNNDVVQCIVTGNMVCAAADSAISDPIVITVNPATAPTVTIASSDTAICAGVNVTFTAAAENGGSLPVYQWRKNGVDVGQNDPTYTAVGLANGDAITVLLTSNATCITPDTVSSNPIVMTVNAPAIVISGDTAVAPGGQTVVSATISGAGSNPGYQWQDSTAAHTWQNINGANDASISYVPAAGGDGLRCILTGATDCMATSNILLFMVSSGISPTRYYPNPVTSTLYIENDDPNDPVSSISVADMMGNHCITLTNISGQALISIDAATLAKGIYMVTLLNSSGKSNHFSFVKL